MQSFSIAVWFVVGELRLKRSKKKRSVGRDWEYPKRMIAKGVMDTPCDPTVPRIRVQFILFLELHSKGNNKNRHNWANYTSMIWTAEVLGCGANPWNSTIFKQRYLANDSFFQIMALQVIHYIYRTTTRLRTWVYQPKTWQTAICWDRTQRSNRIWNNGHVFAITVDLGFSWTLRQPNKDFSKVQQQHVDFALPSISGTSVPPYLF